MKGRQILVVVVLILLLFVGQKVRRFCTGGFSLNKINTTVNWRVDIKEDAEMATMPIATVPKTNLSKIRVSLLEQKFTFLGMGNQVYVFESADHEVVLKIFKQHRFRKPFWREILPNFQVKKRHFKKWANGEKECFLRSLECYKLAFTELKEESALLLMHLNKTDSTFKNVNLFDRIGRRYNVDLDKVIFCLQKRVAPLSSTITSLLKNSKKNEVLAILRKYVQMEIRLLKKGFIDRDPGVRNTALLAGKIIKMDIGNFVMADKRHTFNEHIWKDVNRFILWFNTHSPEIIKDFEDIVREELALNEKVV